LSLSNEEIIKYINSLDKEARALKEEALRISWFMRGGVSYEDAMFLSSQEREVISEIIKKNMETTKESGMPFF
jgi:hypothetical protein